MKAAIITMLGLGWVLSFCVVPAQGQYGGGSGTAKDPYLIYTAEQMNAIGANPDDWDEPFRLMADIDLSDYTGTEFNLIGLYVGWNSSKNKPFTGVFDGNGHTISNFTYDSNGVGYIGLFGYVGGGEVRDVGLIEPDVQAPGSSYVGSLVACNDGEVERCYVEGGSVSGKYDVGGLAGWNRRYRTISNCYSTASASGDAVVGGLVGAQQGRVTGCYSVGSISQTGSFGAAGGLVGWNRGEISNCYSAASIWGTTNVGGLIGMNRGRDDIDVITRCYSTGSVVGDSNVGGLVGLNDDGIVYNNCFWDKQSSERRRSAGGVGKTTMEMQRASTFVGWKCDSAWTIDEGKDYPRLLWENKPGAVIASPSYGGGSGEPNDPYLIYTAEQLNSIGLVLCDYDAHFKLTADIDLSDYTGASFNIIGTSYYNRFEGVFDGDGHTISNFTYISPDGNYIGLFGYVEGGEIRNLGLIDAYIFAGTGDYVGALVGYLDGRREAYWNLSGCYAEGGVIAGVGSYIGGLVGATDRGRISECYSTAFVLGGFSVGGIVGYNGGRGCGGCAKVYNSYSSGSVVGIERVGGLVGANMGEIYNCYSAGGVSADANAGGLVGGNVPSWSEVADKVIGSFWDVDSSGQERSGGGKGKTTEQMQMASTFVGWRCDPVWTIDEGNDYPHLIWEDRPGELITTPSYGGGSGEPNDPYLIYTAEHLNMIGQVLCELDAHFKLMADIDLSGFTGTEFNIIGRDMYLAYSESLTFRGVFDGNGHEISNFNYSAGEAHEVGVFGWVDNGEIRDLGLREPNVQVVTGWNVGSLVGRLHDGVIVGCYVEGGKVSGDVDVGGLVGEAYGDIFECYAASSVSGTSVVGGLAGYVGSRTVSDCYATGSVEGDERVGGLIGCSYRGEISNCYSAGEVLGTTDVGGLVGNEQSFSYWPTAYAKCFWDMDVNLDVNGIGNVDDANVTGKTAAEMQMGSTFIDAGWDFETPIWTIWEGVDYPRLAWENSLRGNFGLDEFWMYQNLPGQSNSDLTASVSVTDDPMGNSSYSYAWGIILPGDVSLSPVTVDGGGASDGYWTFAARGCDEPGGLSDSGQVFTVRVTVTGDDYGNTGVAETEFGIALLGDVNNDGIINVADRSIANAFWRLGSVGAYTLRDCDVNCDGVVNRADRLIANAIWRGILGQNSVSAPCPLR